MTDLTWRFGPSLPIVAGGFTSVPLEDGFMAIGGFD